VKKKKDYGAMTLPFGRWEKLFHLDGGVAPTGREARCVDTNVITIQPIQNRNGDAVWKDPHHSFSKTATLVSHGISRQRPYCAGFPHFAFDPCRGLVLFLLPMGWHFSSRLIYQTVAVGVAIRRSAHSAWNVF